MLRDAMQHVMEIIFFPGNPLAEPGLRKFGNRLHQHVVRALRMSNSFAPCRIRWLRNEPKILGAFRLPFLSSQPPATCLVSDSDVQHELPNAVNVSKRLGRSRSSILILRRLKHSRTMPGIAFECPAKLFGDQSGFGL